MGLNDRSMGQDNFDTHTITVQVIVSGFSSTLILGYPLLQLAILHLFTPFRPSPPPLSFINCNTYRNEILKPTWNPSTDQYPILIDKLPGNPFTLPNVI